MKGTGGRTSCTAAVARSLALPLGVYGGATCEKQMLSTEVWGNWIMNSRGSREIKRDICYISPRFIEISVHLS